MECKTHRVAQQYGRTLCGGFELQERSYALPPRWPVGSMQLVMEQRPGQCDLYPSPAVCCNITGPLADVYIERHVREVLISFLAGCQKSGRRCRTVDLGANNGWFTGLMLALGAHVISVEPQSDLAEAIADSAQVNCWSDNSVVLNAFACGSMCDTQLWDASSKMYLESRAKLVPSRQGVARCRLTERIPCVKEERIPKSGFVPCAGRGCHGLAENAWRIGSSSLSSHPAPLTQDQRARVEAIHKRLKPVGGMSIEHIFLGPHAAGGGSLSRPVHYDLVKVDGDGPEAMWLRMIADLIFLGELSIDTITFEGNAAMTPSVMERFVFLNFSVYRLDVGDERRYMTSHGFDAFSPAGTIGKLDRVRRLPRDDIEEEMFSIRAMRHVFRVRTEKPLNTSEWLSVLQPVRRAHPHFMITRETDLREPSYGEASKRGWRLASLEWKFGGAGQNFTPRDDGMDR